VVPNIVGRIGLLDSGESSGSPMAGERDRPLSGVGIVASVGRSAAAEGAEGAEDVDAPRRERRERASPSVVVDAVGSVDGAAARRPRPRLAVVAGVVESTAVVAGSGVCVSDAPASETSVGGVVGGNRSEFIVLLYVGFVKTAYCLRVYHPTFHAHWMGARAPEDLVISARRPE